MYLWCFIIQKRNYCCCNLNLNWRKNKKFLNQCREKIFLNLKLNAAFSYWNKMSQFAYWSVYFMFVYLEYNKVSVILLTSKKFIWLSISFWENLKLFCKKKGEKYFSRQTFFWGFWTLASNICGDLSWGGFTFDWEIIFKKAIQFSCESIANSLTLMFFRVFLYTIPYWYHIFYFEKTKNPSQIWWNDGTIKRFIN